MTLADSEKASLIRRSAYAWSCLQSGEDAADILSEIYRGNLCDKSPGQGAIMADDLLMWLARFQGGYDAALEDPEAFAACVLKEESAQLPAEQAFRLLGKIAEEPLAGECSPAGLEEGLEKASRVFASPETAMELERTLLAAGEIDAADMRQLRRACGENAVLAVNSMVIYTMAKNRELACVPQEVSLGQVAAAVSADDLLCGIIRDERSGYLSEKEASRCKRALAASFMAAMLAAAAALYGGLSALLACGAAAVFDLICCRPLLEAVGTILPYKYGIDSRMLEREPENAFKLQIKLPRLSAPSSFGAYLQAKHTSGPRAECPPALCEAEADAEECEDEDTAPLLL